MRPGLRHRQFLERADTHRDVRLCSHCNQSNSDPIRPVYEQRNHIVPLEAVRGDQPRNGEPELGILLEVGLVHALVPRWRSPGSLLVTRDQKSHVQSPAFAKQLLHTPDRRLSRHHLALVLALHNQQTQLLGRQGFMCLKDFSGIKTNQMKIHRLHSLSRRTIFALTSLALFLDFGIVIPCGFVFSFSPKKRIGVGDEETLRN